MKFEVSIPAEHFALLLQKKLENAFGGVQVKVISEDATVVKQTVMPSLTTAVTRQPATSVVHRVAFESVEPSEPEDPPEAEPLELGSWDGKRRLTFFTCGECGSVNIRWADGNNYSAEDRGFVFECHKCDAVYLFEPDELLPVYYTCSCCKFSGRCYMPKDYALDFLKCKQCQAPIDLFYNAKKHCFSSSSEGGEADG